MATSSRSSPIVAYDVQTAVDAKHHLVVAHEVANVGNDRSALAPMAEKAREAMGTEKFESARLEAGRRAAGQQPDLEA